jgi:hypothetical protein
MVALVLDQPSFSRTLYKNAPVYKHTLRRPYRDWFLSCGRTMWRAEEWAELADGLEAQGYADAAAKMRDAAALGGVM